MQTEYKALSVKQPPLETCMLRTAAEMAGKQIYYNYQNEVLSILQEGIYNDDIKLLTFTLFLSTSGYVSSIKYQFAST